VIDVDWPVPTPEPVGTERSRSATTDASGGPAPSIAVSRPMLGGTVGVHIRPADPGIGGDAIDEGGRILDRVSAWASRLTRFADHSDLVRLNRDSHVVVPVRPTLAAVLDWGREAQCLTDGIVDIAMLDARVAAEVGAPVAVHGGSQASRAWSLDRGKRGARVRRPVGLRFDLDGVAKGWMADRALTRSGEHRLIVVDADGDLAIRVHPGTSLTIDVVDPRTPGAVLAGITIRSRSVDPPDTFGLATSGTTIHRWTVGDREAHHLIDPRTGSPAQTDVIQATVLAGSARAAEALAKTAVILGSNAALGRLSRPDVLAAILLTETGDVLATPETSRWLA